MKTHVKKLSVLLLTLCLMCAASLPAFAAEQTKSAEPDQIVILSENAGTEDNPIIIEEGVKYRIPLLAEGESEAEPGIAPYEIFYGNGGYLDLWAEGTYVKYNIVTNQLSSRFDGYCNIVCHTTGFDEANTLVNSFSGQVWYNAVRGRQYRASLHGVAYWGTTVVAKTTSNSIFWRINN